MKKLKKTVMQKILRKISHLKNEPDWMLENRLLALDIFKQKKMPGWGPDLSDLDFTKLNYYNSLKIKKTNSWSKVPREIKETFEKIGIPQAERKFLAGVGAQYDSEVIYNSISQMLVKKGVIFVDSDTALQKYPQVVKKYFGSVVSSSDNKFAALNTAFWSGGSFIYVPPGVRVDLPLQAYFLINARNLGQFERTIIIADEGSFVHYVEGCSAPIYKTNSLHAAVVEIIVKKGARVRYTTIQNWSKNVYNLVTKRMFVEEGGIGEWVDCNLGSKVSMKYPSIYLKGKKARGELLSLSFAGKDQNQDTGGKIYHLAPQTNSLVVSKTISKKHGKNTFRGLIKIIKGAKNCQAKMSCDSLLLGKDSQTASYPTLEVEEKSSRVTHEAVVSSLEDNQLFYLQSRGISKAVAEALLINGFIEPIVKELPLEYAVELNRLIQMEMENV